MLARSLYSSDSDDANPDKWEFTDNEDSHSDSQDLPQNDPHLNIGDSFRHPTSTTPKRPLADTNTTSDEDVNLEPPKKLKPTKVRVNPSIHDSTPSNKVTESAPCHPQLNQTKFISLIKAILYKVTTKQEYRAKDFNINDYSFELRRFVENQLASISNKTKNCESAIIQTILPPQLGSENNRVRCIIYNNMILMSTYSFCSLYNYIDRLLLVEKGVLLPASVNLVPTLSKRSGQGGH
jgi:hypothetical protein